MKPTNLIFAAALAAFTITMASGCTVAREQETVGQYIDGSAITAKVKAKLAQDKQTSAANINVKTIDGGVVQLSGFAKSVEEKNRAGQLARSVEGVSSVSNDLVVKP